MKKQPNMVLVDYIKTTTGQGFHLERVRKALLDVGHKRRDVHHAIRSVFPDYNALPKLPAYTAMAALLIIALVSGVLMVRFINSQGSFLSGGSSAITGQAVAETPGCSTGTSEEKDWCHYQLAKAHADIGPCREISNYELRDFCLDAFQGYVDCTLIADPILEQQCMAR
ncbi:hypothetical protein J4227_03285 [Candidatus Woesearchaeota archaeon]|nr:hypothetical protein [Candidatus Woesearchaeota archaeon]